MQAVILAAGRNERLWDTGVAPYMKPMIEIENVPMIVRHVQAATDYAHRCVVVVSPHNVVAITDAIGQNDDVRYVIQPEPAGPGDALMRGLEACENHQHVLVICADNVISDEDYRRVAECGNTLVVATGIAQAEDAGRFTRISNNRFFEGPVNEVPTGMGASYNVWLGPLIVPRDASLQVLHRMVGVFKDMRVAPMLDELARAGHRPRLVHCEVTDIGTPEAMGSVFAGGKL